MKTLKTKLASALLVAGILLTATLWPKAQAQPSPNKSHATAILYLYSDVDGGFYISGFSVDGMGVPEIKRGESAAVAINKLRDAGLRLMPPSDPLFYVLTR